MPSATNGQLLSFIQRIERLDEERRAISEDIAEIKKECKSAGFDMKTVNALLKRRKLTDQERDEQDALLETYEHAIQQALPLADAPSDPGVKRARDRLKSGIDNLIKDPGTAISVTSGGVTTKLENLGGTRVLTQTGEPTTDLGPPRSAVAASVDALRTQLRG